MSFAAALDTSLQSDDGIQALAALVALMLALGVLLIGVASPDPRLVVQGIPLSTVFFLAAGIVAASIPCLPGTRKAVVIALLPVSLLILTLPVSVEPVAGASKVLNLLASVLVSSVLLAAAIQRLGTEAVLRWFAVLMAVLLAGAILFKLRFGFFDRQVPFLMHGPIVFARLMGLACLGSLAAFRGSIRVWLTLAFFFAVVWTGSKGPILALLVAIALHTWILGSRRERLVSVGLFAGLVVGISLGYQWLSQWPPLGRVFLAIDSLSAIGGTGMDSVGSRVLLLREAIEIMHERPLGIGVGSWSAHTGIHWTTYPHNFLFELWNEGGLVLGSIAAVPYLAFVLRRPDPWWIACIFLLLCQQVSGDLLDSRYWLSLAIVGFLCRAEGGQVPVTYRREPTSYA